MSARSLGLALMRLSVVGALAAAVWWDWFYTEVARALGSTAPLPVECLYQTAGPCSFVSTLAAWGGKTPYNPDLLYAALGSLLLGFSIFMVDSFRRDMEPPGNYPPPSTPQPGRTRDFR